MLQSLGEKYKHTPNYEALNYALEGWEKLGKELKKPLLTVIDFTLPSTEKRLWVIDVEKREILLNSVVAHGRNTGELMAKSFSNTPESFQSSLGFFKTAETYQGKHGYSLRLDGLEKGFNDQARARAIVIHGADYASEEFAKSTGRLGRSLGCPALPPDLSSKVIDLIKDGSLLFIYGNDENYLKQSALVQP
ncbi:murein L,D-transpeptidase catalytic domain family protein [Algoriphagus boritolerans]|uniref:murein L,D-transpeptidase catalytic domain family protein n=1 Tax=Algoriphagus boritolerans TaxID=308111 RepID=UPI002FCE221F